MPKQKIFKKRFVFIFFLAIFWLFTYNFNKKKNVKNDVILSKGKKGKIIWMALKKFLSNLIRRNHFFMNLSANQNIFILKIKMKRRKK